VTTEAATGQLVAEVQRAGFGLILKHLTGSTTSPVQQAATTAYLQTHAWGDNTGLSLTGQMSTPATGGTAHPWTGLGGKITGVEFSCAVNELLKATVDLDFKKVVETETLATASYTAGNMPFHFGEMAVKLGTFASEASVTGVRGVSVKIERPQDTEMFYAGAAGLKAQPVWNEFLNISGTIEVDLVTKADFIDRFTGHTSTSMVLEWVGTTAIASTYYPTFRIVLPKVYFSGDVPSVDGPDVVKASVPFKAMLDTTNGICTAYYQSTDTTV
jgi:hypothetical protein